MRIALGHKSRVGKDTCADYLEVLMDDPIRLSFAALLYKCCDAIQEILDKPVEKDRALLIALGQTLKKIYPNIWCDKLEESIVPGRNIIVTDVRFKHEYEMLKRHGFVIIRVDREDYTPTDVDAELQDCKFDHVIDNNGSIPHLHHQLKNIYLHAKYGEFAYFNDGGHAQDTNGQGDTRGHVQDIRGGIH